MIVCNVLGIKKVAFERKKRYDFENVKCQGKDKETDNVKEIVKKTDVKRTAWLVHGI